MVNTKYSKGQPKDFKNKMKGLYDENFNVLTVWIILLRYLQGSRGRNLRRLASRHNNQQYGIIVLCMFTNLAKRINKQITQRREKYENGSMLLFQPECRIKNVENVYDWEVD